MHQKAECPGRMLASVALRYRQAVPARSWPPRRHSLRGCDWLCQAERDEDLPEGPTARSESLARLEAALFLAREPTGSRKLAELASLADGTEARTLVRKLNRLYDLEGCAFRVAEVAGGFQLLSRAKFVPWLQRLHASPVEVRLSTPAMETLAVVAYRQPVLRAEIEAVRGVQCGEILRQLMERELVRIVGRSEELGRPFLYGTTKRFLEVFGLRHLDELPRTRAAVATPSDVALAGPPQSTIERESADEPTDSSKTEGGSKVSSALDAIVAVEEDTASVIEEENVPVPTAEEDHSDYDDEFDDEDEDYDDYDYDEDEYDDEEEEEDEDEDDEGFEDEDWEEVEDEDDEDEDEEEEEDWEDEDEEDWGEDDDEDWDEDEEEGGDDWD